MNKIGVMYYEGKGVEQDYQKQCIGIKIIAGRKLHCYE